VQNNKWVSGVTFFKISSVSKNDEAIFWQGGFIIFISGVISIVSVSPMGS